jgi:hypothetical protein
VAGHSTRSLAINEGVAILKYASIIAGIALSGCATTGGDIGGLLPAPKFLKGSITGDVYTSSDGSLSIAVPHKEGSYEYKYMQVKEQYSPLGDYISFGPAALDRSIYRVETAKRATSDGATRKTEDIAPQVVDGYKAQLANAYGTTPQQVAASTETLAGRRAYYWKLSQEVPAGKYLNNQSATFTHHVYVVDLELGPVVVWVQLPPERAERPALEPRSFAESVKRR